MNTLLSLTSTVGRRRASSIDSDKQKKVERIQAKYSKGDLGEMGPDLNYTIKRLVRGLSSENNLTKKGFFFASVQVYARFATQIDGLKLLEHIQEQMQTAKTMKHPEINALHLGKMMCLSALIESEIFLQMKNQKETIKLLLQNVTDLYMACNFLRESLISVIQSLLHRAKNSSSTCWIITHLIEKLFNAGNGNRVDKFNHPDQVSLYLVLQ